MSRTRRDTKVLRRQLAEARAEIERLRESRVELFRTIIEWSAPERMAKAALEIASTTTATVEQAQELILNIGGYLQEAEASGQRQRRIDQVEARIEQLINGDHTDDKTAKTQSRDFGRGVAWAAKDISYALYLRDPSLLEHGDSIPAST